MYIGLGEHIIPPLLTCHLNPVRMKNRSPLIFALCATLVLASPKPIHIPLEVYYKDIELQYVSYSIVFKTDLHLIVLDGMDPFKVGPS